MAKKKSTKTPPTQKKPETTEIQGLLWISAASIMLLSLLSFAYGHESKNWLGLTGQTIGWVFHACFGICSYLICFYISWIGWRLLFNRTIYYPALKTLAMGGSVLSLSFLLSLLEDQNPQIGNALGNFFYTQLWQRKLYYHLGGAPFYYIYRDLPLLNLHRIFNTVGMAIIFSSTFIASMLFLFRISPAELIRKIIAIFSFPKVENVDQKYIKETEALPEASKEKILQPESDFMRFVKLRIPYSASHQANESSPIENPTSLSQEMLGIQPEKDLKIRPSLSRKEQIEIKQGASFEDFSKIKPKDNTEIPYAMPENAGTRLKPAKDLIPTAQRKKEAALTAQRVHNGDFTDFIIPPVNLLTNAKKVDQSSLKKDLKRQAEVLEETLQSFGIEAKVGQINCGPTITSFEVHPAIGVKVQKIKALENDIALNMEAKSIRIIAPIPGKAAVGIEVPNAQPQEVGFKEMLTAYQQCGRKFHIPVLLGKAVNGDYVMNDLTKMPHCIIAGATGSGKSVCINTIVMSILLNCKPDEVKLIMVDPKKVELTPYTCLPHMLAPVITEPQGACAALLWLVKEMENRYEILKLIGVRNIESFNNRKIDKTFEEGLGKEIPEKMPYMVGIIDELADLMMVSSNDIETPIARIAQMARAVGIHLILATQRPSREVITGLIKANFPTRIAFKVASRVNSQIILDETGAETLLGNGDMLFLPPGASHLTRAQGAFIRDEDINAVVKQICDQAPPHYVIESFDRYQHVGDTAIATSPEEPTDDLYNKAYDAILSTGIASTTFLQRKLKVGYPRAASLIDELELRGVVGPADGSKPRKILAGRNAGDSEMEESLK
jgi:DNA segregation ATPase FtsK/SpoIIIE, S-DNA-T family